jgi:molecular chaperone HscA
LGKLQEAAAKSDDPLNVESAIKQLEETCAFYVERRMNSGIRKAMAGHRVTEFSGEDGDNAD